MRHWRVLVGCFLGMGVSTSAILLLPMGLFLKSLTAEFGWSRTQFSEIISTALLFNAIVMPIAGYLVDRFGPRRIIALGTVLGCGSYAALSAAHSFGAFIGTVVSSVMLGSLASYPAFMGLTQRWFDKRLGLALAVTSTGQAVGGRGVFIRHRPDGRLAWVEGGLRLGRRRGRRDRTRESAVVRPGQRRSRSGGGTPQFRSLAGPRGRSIDWRGAAHA